MDMKKQCVWALAAALSTGSIMVSCTEEPHGGEGSGETLSRYVIAASAGGDQGATYLVTTDNLDSGSLL